MDHTDLVPGDRDHRGFVAPLEHVAGLGIEPESFRIVLLTKADTSKLALAHGHCSPILTLFGDPDCLLVRFRRLVVAAEVLQAICFLADSDAGHPRLLQPLKAPT